MKFNSFYSQIISLIVPIGLSGCASAPTNIIVAPDIFSPAAIHYNNQQAQLNVIDMRTANHVVQILRKGEAATLIPAQERLEYTIKNKLIEHWKMQSLAINLNATNKITVEIDKAVISVNQEMMEYNVQTEIVLKVSINNGEQTLTSTFKNRGNSDGPFSADIAVLERDFNQRLAKLIQQILANEKINNFLK